MNGKAPNTSIVQRAIGRVGGSLGNSQKPTKKHPAAMLMLSVEEAEQQAP